MACEFHATCECGYRSRGLMLGTTCVCPSCRDLVGVPSVPFRYALGPCPACGTPMFEDDSVTDILGKGWLRPERPSELTCPKCEGAKLQFHVDAYVTLIHESRFPSPGDLIDGRLYHQGIVNLPWFTVAEGAVRHDVPADVRPGERITLRVAKIVVEPPTDPARRSFDPPVVRELQLHFVSRTLPERRRPKPSAE